MKSQVHKKCRKVNVFKHGDKMKWFWMHGMCNRFLGSHERIKRIIRKKFLIHGIGGIR